MTARDRPLVWLHGEVKTPPFGPLARREAGFLLRLLQQGSRVGLPHARPMPQVGARCMELRINDDGVAWRIVLRADPEAVVILAVFDKKTEAIPQRIIEMCRRRLRRYELEIEPRGGVDAY